MGNSHKNSKFCVSDYWRYRRILRSLESLLKKRVLKASEYTELVERARALYKQAQKEQNKGRIPKPRGRPKSAGDRGTFEKCKKIGCQKKPSKGQAYCSRDHAPFGHYGLEEFE